MASQADIRRVDNSIDNAKKNLYESRRGPDAFDKRSMKSDGKYSISQHVYPDDLMSDDLRYGGNYVVFYINVSVDSKLLDDKTVKTVADFPPRDGGDFRAQEISKSSLAIGSAAQGAIAGGLVKGDITGAVAGAALAGGGIAIASTMTDAPKATRPQKRLKTAIALHVPTQLSVKYGMQWGEEDTAVTAAMAAVGKSGYEAIIAALKDSEANQKFVGTSQAVATSLALSKAPGGGAASVGLGLTPNPKKEQAFKSVDFRTFSFDYQFFPRDVGEAKNVLNIIKTFKYHMHPEFKDDNNFVYVYPSEFDIFYYNNGMENLNIHRHTSCVLETMNVNYTPNGNFNTFANGMPTQINVSLQFKELALLTKDKIQDGL